MHISLLSDRDLSAAPADWPELDTTLLEERRGAVPAFPLDLLPPPWRDWIADTAGSAGAPVDYVALSVLAAVAGLCGAGAAVRVTEAWREPMVLWPALVGGPSSGRSPALAPMRGLLAVLEEEWRAVERDGQGPSSQGSSFVVDDPSFAAIAESLSARPRGVVLWRDDLAGWLAGLDDADRAAWRQAWAARAATIEGGGRRKPLRLERFAVSLFGAMEPERLEESLPAAGAALAGRFLYAWPGRPAYRPLAERRTADDAAALARLRRIARKARTPDDPLELVIDPRGDQPFDAFLAGLDAEVRQAEGPEAAWLGKGGGTVARLAGVLELLAWSGLEAPGSPGHLGAAQVDAAVALWTGYFRPHARVVFDRGVPSDLERRARRVMLWLKDGKRTEVSREEVRREALGRTVTAHGADQVLYRLTALGAVRSMAPVYSPRGGRPAQRWQVNPVLANA